MEQSKKYDIHNTKEVLVLVLKTGDGVKKSLEDGKFEATDAVNFMPLIPLLQPAIEGASEIPSELKDLDAQETQELVDLVAKDLGVLANAPRLIEQINTGLALVKAGVAFYKTVKPEPEVA
jgi:hypothetical protein